MDKLTNKTKKDGGVRKDVCVVKSSGVSARNSSYASKAGGSCGVALSDSVSDAESMSSVCSVTLEQLSPYWRKRLESPVKRRHEEEIGSEVASTDDEATPANSVVVSAKRGRGRPPTSGAYVGKAKAQAELNALRREDERLRFEEEIAAQVARNKATRVVAPPERLDVENSVAAELVRQVADASQVILDVAAKSGNLKGTLAKALKVSAASIKAAVEELSKRSSTEETVMLQADNARLKTEMAELRKEFTDFRAKMSEKKETGTAPSSHSESSHQQEELIRSVLLQVGSMVNARFESMEERLLPETRTRPPLAADRRKTASASEKSAPSPASEEQPASQAPKRKQKKKSDAAPEAMKAPEMQPQDLPSAAKTADEGWSTVTGRKKKATAKQAAAVPKPAKASKPKQRKIKLRPPRSAAVVITLQPGAVEKGATYAHVLMAAKEKIDLSSCGITSLRFRKAATGARILEVAAGDASGEKADSLALKLREALGEEVARFSRPTKCAEFRLTGLDDSVSKADIATAIAERGGCSVEAIKVGEIKASYQGTGTTLVSGPVAAVKKLGEEGRLLVGWVSARVEIVRPRPLRCYRCLEDGHVRAQCTAATDRSDECYRCGQSGHKSATCSAAAKCSICAAANKPSDHRLGSKVCAPPKSRRSKTQRATASSAETASSCPPAQTGDERARMEAD